MRIPRLFHPGLLNVGAKVQLSDSAFQHAVRVLRLRMKAPIILFNGQGGEYSAHLCSIEKRSALAHVDSFNAREAESPIRVTLGQSLSKSEHMDITLQKATELGVVAIQPLVSERSLPRLQGDRLQKKRAHWQGVILSACEQCGRNRVPMLHDSLPLSDWVHTVSGRALNLVLDPLSTRGLSQLSGPTGSINLLVGPEGGLSADELRCAYDEGFMGIRLGPRVLRTETAALTILAAMNTLWGDLV